MIAAVWGLYLLPSHSKLACSSVSYSLSSLKLTLPYNTACLKFKP